MWKYGTAVDPEGRYPASALKNLNLKFKYQAEGTQEQVLAAEKIQLIDYANIHGSLPPGNRVSK